MEKMTVGKHQYEITESSTDVINLGGRSQSA